MSIIVHVVDDDEPVRDSLRFLLEQAGLPVRTHASARSLLDADMADAGCVVTDFFMPGMDGLALQQRLAERHAALPVIVMTGHADVPVAVRAMKAGAVDFLEKPFSEQALLAAVGLALARRRQTLAAAALARGVRSRVAGLTPREQEVMQLMVTGQSSKEIGRALGASPRTIDVHRARVLQKMQAGSLPELVMLALAAAEA